MVIDVIRQALKGPEKKFIYISFQNILNNHYDTVFDIIHHFKNITLKDVKEFKVFQVKEMPQDLDKITFSTKYKKAVDKFYEMLSENSSDKFCDLLDTLPHEKKSAIFLLKLKLRCRKMIGGDITDLDDDDAIEKAKKKGITTRNMTRILHALYASTMDIFIILGDNLLKSTFKIKVPLESGKTNKFWDAQTGGLHGQTTDDKYLEAVRPFADKLSANIIKYFSEVNESVLKTEGFKQLINLFSPENIGAYINEIGIAAKIDTFIPFETLKLTSEVIEFLAAQTKEVSYQSDIVNKEEEKRIRRQLDVYKNNLELLQKEIEELLCLIKNKNPRHGKLIDDILAHEMKREGLEMKFECPHKGGKNEIFDQLQVMKNTIDNKKTNETLMQQELYYIVVISNNIKNIISKIDSTNGDSLTGLRMKAIEIESDYHSLKSQFGQFREVINSDPNLKN